MALLTTTIKVEAASLCPTPLNFTAVNKETISGSFKDFGRISLTSNSLTDINIKECGPNGAILYAFAATTNTRDVILYSSNVDSTNRIACLKPGDTMLIPLTAFSGTVKAQIINGEDCILDYFICDREGSFGENSILFFKDTTWKYVIFDAAMSEARPVVNTGLSVADYGYPSFNFVQNKGYWVSFGKEGNVYRYIALRANGSVAYSSISDENFYTETSPTGTYIIGTNFVKIFDGENFYSYDFGSYPSYVYSTHDSAYSVGNGAAVFRVNNYDDTGVDGYYLLHKGNKFLLETGSNNIDNTDIWRVSTYEFTNTIVMVKCQVDTPQTYDTIRIYDTSGSLLKSVDLTPIQLTYLEFDWYGNGRLQMIGYNDAGEDWYMFNYDESTNILIGENLDWTHTRGGGFSQYQVYCKTKNLFGTHDFGSNSIVIAYWYDTEANNNGRFLNWSVSNLDFIVLFDGETVPTEYKFDTNTNGNQVRLNIEDPTNDSFFFYSASSYTGVDLYLNTFSKGKGFHSITSLTSLQFANNVSNSNGIDYTQTGDYYLETIYDDEISKTMHRVIKNNSAGVPVILDTLTVDGNQTNIRTRKNSIFFRNWNTGKNYYFDVSTNKWREISKFYSRRDYPYITYDNSVNNGVMYLFHPMYWENKLRTLNNGVLYDDFTLPDSDGSEDWNYYVGDDRFVWIYTKRVGAKYLYSFDLYSFYDGKYKLLNTYQSETSHQFNIDIAGKRILVATRDDESVNEYRKFVCINPNATMIQIIPNSDYSFEFNDLRYND